MSRFALLQRKNALDGELKRGLACWTKRAIGA